MKQSLLFAIHYLELGGAENSLIGLLESLDYGKYDVDLFVYSHRGELMGAIPTPVHLLPEIPEYAQLERPLKDVVKSGYFRIAAARLRGRYEYKRYARRTHPRDGSAVFQYVARKVAPLMPAINPRKEYDMAISWLAPHDYVLQKVKAKKKICWIHTDYSEVDVDASIEAPVWGAYDRIVAITESVRKAFLTRFPELDDKIEVKANLLPRRYIASRADSMPKDIVDVEMPRRENTVNLLSVGRFCHAKNYDSVPDICRRLNVQLNPQGLSAVWYLIGYGPDEALIKGKIDKEGSGGQVVILGKKDNPYPYMKACDLYVQPSRYEGDPVTVHEAAALGKSVILTNFPTVADVADSIGNATIVPLDNPGCAASIASIIKAR